MKKAAGIITGSFILIMLIHIIVFTSIGIFTPYGFRLLKIFIAGLILLAMALLLLVPIAKKNPSASWINYIPLLNKILKWKKIK